MSVKLTAARSQWHANNDNHEDWKMISTRHSCPRLLRPFFAIFLAGIIIGSIASCNSQVPALSPSIPLVKTATSSDSPTQAPTQTPYIVTATSQNSTSALQPQNVFFLALADSGYTHIFAYSPLGLFFTRLTTGECDDTSPALSPDTHWLVYRSNCNGYWNLYTVNLASGEIIQMTDSPEYKGNPSWSPDGAFIAYDTYINNNLEIFIRSTTDIAQAPINLTQDPAMDTQPAWYPLLPGRQIAFVSNRSGEPEIWVVNLDTASFTNVSQDPYSVESHPAWSPDGSKLAWAATDLGTGLGGIYVWDSHDPGAPAKWIGSGSWPVWQDSTHLFAGLTSPNQYYLTGFDLSGALSLPPILLPAPLDGLAYGPIKTQLPGSFQQSAVLSPTPLFESALEPQPGDLPGRASLVPLEGVQAPYPQIHELADASFEKLRERVAFSVGWDALASLENAYIPLTTSLDPGLGEDWLYTGRAFTLNPALIDAGWMTIAREDFGQQTYWRIYLRATAQDGSQGAPLSQVPWDFSARAGNPTAYENGGRLTAKVPSGYWFDLTYLANQYGWQRFHALTNWRTYYGGARFNELVYTQGLDWRSAMLQLYPPEVLVTPTVVIPPTRTPTRTPMWYRSPTPTSTPTNRPTITP